MNNTKTGSGYLNLPLKERKKSEYKEGGDPFLKKKRRKNLPSFVFKLLFCFLIFNLFVSMGIVLYIRYALSEEKTATMALYTRSK